jgi:hypothetical protein
MLRHVECRIVESELLEPCRAISPRRVGGNGRENVSKPSRPAFREGCPTREMNFVANSWRHLLTINETYPLGMFVDVAV